MLFRSQLLQSAAHGLNANALVVGDEGGGQADVHGSAALEQDASLLGAVHDLLGVLGAHHEAVAAEDALVADDMGLVAREANGLHGAMADALMAVLTVGFLQSQAICHVDYFPSLWITSRIFFLKNSLKFSLVTPT